MTDHPQAPNLAKHGGEPGNTALVKRDVEAWRDPDWQRLWLNLVKQPWTKLSLVPAGQGADPDFTLSLAVGLSRTGMTHLGEPVLVADGTNVALNELNEFMAEVQTCAASGRRVLVALPAIEDRPTAPTIVKATDAAVLCVLLERMAWGHAKQTLKTIGPSRFLGSIIVQLERP